MLPSRIISGGQTGADQAGLDFAIANRIPHGGWCPHGRRCDGGVIPAVYSLKETPGDSGYNRRTRYNAQDADATVIFNRGSRLSPGSSLTLRCCQRAGRPVLLMYLHEDYRRPSPDSVRMAGRKVAEFLAHYQPGILNIAGNREASSPGISSWVFTVLGSAWNQYDEVSLSATPRCEQTCLALPGFDRPSRSRSF